MDQAKLARMQQSVRIGIGKGTPRRKVKKELTELVPGILNQLGPDSLASLRKLAESYQNMQKNQAGADGKKDDEEDDIPDLVEGENFESNVE
nr:nascent polypeptide-associated complex subunit beta [Aspergillus niger CBS 513.88]|eukprot:XP_003188858.1 nascent polypeptide-associated complex subunit beta [Aspergillus niger CBS 513.88]